MSAQTSPRIVVGIDDSPGARLALRWAADEARRNDAELHVVHAWQITSVAHPMGIPMQYAAPLDALQADAEAFLRQVVEDELGSTSGLRMRVEAIHAPVGAAAALLEAAKDATMLVVGSRGRGGFAGLLLGSVSQQCASHAACPVVIVPRPPRRPTSDRALAGSAAR